MSAERKPFLDLGDLFDLDAEDGDFDDEGDLDPLLDPDLALLLADSDLRGLFSGMVAL